MINPGVILLASLRYANYRFDIEDNIGEAIHIHYLDMRLDLTIKEFFALASDIEKITDMLMSENRVSRLDFDSAFFIDLVGYVPDLEKITFETVMLADLQVDTCDETGAVSIRSLKESRVIKALNGDTAENDMREQTNYFSPKSYSRLTNQERLYFNLDRIKKQEGFVNTDIVTLFNASNVIRDGQHSAACLYFLKGNVPVPARRLWFQNDNYSFIPKRGNTGYYGNLYIDTGKGFSEEERITFEADDVAVGKVFNIPERSLSVRYDPLEGAFCCVTDLEVRNSKGKLVVENINGHDVGGMFAFYTTDPQLLVSIEDGAGPWIEIKASIKRITYDEVSIIVANMEKERGSLVDEIDSLAGEKKSLINERDSFHNERDLLESEVGSLIVERDRLENERDLLESEVGSLIVERDRLENERDSFRNERDLLANERDMFASERDALTDERNAILNSTSWKLTRSLRATMRLIKKCIRRY